jgi:hypothetical protein
VHRARLILAGVIAAVLAAGCAASPARPGTYYTDPPPRPTASPVPHPAEADAAVRAFGALKARQDLTFHVVETLSTTGAGGLGTITIDVAGSDLSAIVKPAGGTSVEIRHIGAVTFARVGKGKWRAGAADERVLDEITDPWLFLCWLDALEYTGPADKPADGLAFACADPYTYQSPTMRSDGKVGRVESLELVLKPDGTPVRMAVSGTGPTLASTTETFKATFVFSKVGGKIVIKAPKT